MPGACAYFEGEPTGIADELDVECERKWQSDLKALTGTTRRLELPLTETGKTAEEQV